MLKKQMELHRAAMAEGWAIIDAALNERRLLTTEEQARIDVLTKEVPCV